MGTHPIVQGMLGPYLVAQGFEGNTTPVGGGAGSPVPAFPSALWIDSPAVAPTTSVTIG